MDSHYTEEQLHQTAQNIRLLILDVDGVLTDGKLYFSNSGEEMKAFSTLDGHGIKLLRSSGVEVAIITGRKSNLVAKRASDLGIHLIAQGREDKFVALQELLENHPVTLENIAYIGDDHPDLLVMTRVALGVAVSNAHPDVIAHANWITQRKGGEGAVREVVDIILKAQGNHSDILKTYIG